jgi:hypothetical protein
MTTPCGSKASATGRREKWAFQAILANGFSVAGDCAMPPAPAASHARTAAIALSDAITRMP